MRSSRGGRTILSVVTVASDAVPRLEEVDLGVCRGIRFDAGSDRWTIVLPGAFYPVTAPLLWFAREAALSAGCSVLAVDDRYDRNTEPLRWVEERARAAIDHVGADTRPLIVAKSITSLASSLGAELSLPGIWLTPLINAGGTSVSAPVMAGLRAGSVPLMLIGGTADPSWDGAVARSLPGAEVLEIVDADHSLQVPGDMDRSLETLRRVASAVRRFAASADTQPDAEVGHLTGLDHVQLAMPAGGEARAREFYGDLLGLAEVAEPEALLERGGCWFVGRGVHLHLGVETEFHPATKAHPGLRVERLAALCDRLTAAGISVVADEAIVGVRRCYASDPFGNRLEFIEDADSGFTQR